MNRALKHRTLIFSLGYLPTFGGSYRVLHELISRSDDNDIVLVTCTDASSAAFDGTVNYTIRRNFFISLLNEDYAISDSPLFKSFVGFSGFRLIRKVFKYIVFPVISMGYVISTIVTERCDKIVFAQSVHPFAWYIVLLKGLTRKKIATFVYGEDIVSYRKPGRVLRVLERLYLRGLRAADVVCANSSVTRSECENAGVHPEKITVVYPAVDYDVFTIAKKNSSQLEFGLQDRFVLLTVGRLIRRKGFDTVIDILPSLRESIPNIVYVICGDGYDKEYLKSKTKSNGVSDCVVFLKNVSYSSLPHLYAASNIFVMPNRLDERDNEQEGFGIVLLEANACGIPVIGGDSGGVRDIIRNEINGYLVNPSDKEELLRRILALRDNATVMTPQGIRESVTSRYSWEQSAKVFQEMLHHDRV